MLPTRRTQPHRKGARRPSAALDAMVAGKPTFLANPQDVARATALLGARRRPRRRTMRF